jgi:hypothetical protein
MAAPFRDRAPRCARHGDGKQTRIFWRERLVRRVRSEGRRSVRESLGAPLAPRLETNAAAQNGLRKLQTSAGIHDMLCPESVGDAVWPPSYEHQTTGSAAGHPE